MGMRRVKRRSDRGLCKQSFVRSNTNKACQLIELRENIKFKHEDRLINDSTC